MRPHSNDTLVLPFSPFPRSRFTGLQTESLYFGPHDTQERRIVSYRFSYRCVELCLFESPRAYSLGTVSHWLSYHSHPIRPCGAPSPRGEGCDTRIPSSKKGGEAATSTLNLEPNEGKQKAHLCRCAFMLISSLFLPAIPANRECKTKQKGPTIYMIDPF